MTPAEFAQGWKLLILQPWGWRYRSLTTAGQPSEESRAQLEFYYAKLSFGHPKAWMETASLFAEGTEWPSVGQLRQTLTQVQSRHVTLVADHRRQPVVPMPKAVRQKLQDGGILKSMPSDGDKVD